MAETYGQDLLTGAEHTAEQYKAQQPGGRAFLHAVDYHPSPEVTSDEFPLLLATGRTVYHFHTRTKTGRVPQLDAAAPEVWVEVSAVDAQQLGLREGDLVRVQSPRGSIEARARICGVRQGVVFVPFHYGQQAANELTMTAWDPVSKQPLFKVAAVRLVRVGSGPGPSGAPTVGGSAPLDTTIPATKGGGSALVDEEGIL